MTALQADNKTQGSSRPNSHTPTFRPISIHLHPQELLPIILSALTWSSSSVAAPASSSSLCLWGYDALGCFLNHLPPLSSTWPFRKSDHQKNIFVGHQGMKIERRTDRPEFEWPEILGAIALAPRARPTASLLLCLPLCRRWIGSFEIGPKTTACPPVAALALLS